MRCPDGWPALRTQLGASQKFAPRCLQYGPFVAKASSESYGWLEDEAVAAFAAAGCVTVTIGSSRDDALAAVGADIDHSADATEVSGAEGVDWISAASEVSGFPEGVVVLIEDAGWQGSRPEVLSRLSKKGAAASVSWNVDGLVMFGCARRGRVQASLEVPDTDEDAAELPAALRRVWVRERARAGPVAVGMAMVEKFTGIAVPPAEAIARPRVAHPITEPVLAFRVTLEELLGLRLPSLAVVEAAQAASGSRCRLVAEWAVKGALVAADIAELPQLASTLAQFGCGLPLALTAAATSYRREADRGMDAAGWTLSVEGDLDTWEKLRHWGPRYWAMEALAYLAVPDDLAAVLGASYCAGIRHELGSETHEQFLRDVAERLRS